MKMQDKGKMYVWYATTYLRVGEGVTIHKHTHMATVIIFVCVCFVIIFNGRKTTTFLKVILLLLLLSRFSRVRLCATP